VGGARHLVGAERERSSAVPLNITATDRKVNDKYEKRRWRYMDHDQNVL
jgi:hypothetical protein